MYFTAPSSARQGDRIQVTVNGLPNGTEGVKFIASGNSGIDIIAASGGNATFTISLDLPGTTTIEAIAQDKYGGTLASISHAISVKDKGFDTSATPPHRFGMGGSLSGISEAIVGTLTDIYAQGSGDAEQVEFSASNADMGWMMPVQISPGGSTSASVRLNSEGTATIYAKFMDKLGNVLGQASHAIRVVADPAKKQGSTDLAALMNSRAEDILKRLGNKS